MLGPIDAIRASISFREQAAILRKQAAANPAHGVLAHLMEEKAHEADKDVVTWILGTGAAAGLFWWGWRK